MFKEITPKINYENKRQLNKKGPKDLNGQLTQKGI